MNRNREKSLDKKLNSASHERQDLTQDNLKETLETTKKVLLSKVAQNYFENHGLSNFCWKGWQECTDWSDLYILTKEGIVKIWCWEFNSDTFINWTYSRYEKKYLTRCKLNKSPLPLYVVNQDNSYFAGPWLVNLMNSDPKGYLEKYSVLRFNPNAQEWKRTSNYMDNDIELDHETERFGIDENSILSVDDTILLFRNLLFEDFDKDVVSEYMKSLQSLSFEELRDYARNAENIEDPVHKEIWYIIYNKLWWYLVWAGIYGSEAIESRKKIIDSYDTKEKKFTYIPESQEMITKGYTVF